MMILSFSIILPSRICFTLLTVSPAFAGPWKGRRGSGGWGMGSQYNRMYNPTPVETVAGTGG